MTINFKLFKSTHRSLPTEMECRIPPIREIGALLQLKPSRVHGRAHRVFPASSLHGTPCCASMGDTFKTLALKGAEASLVPPSRWTKDHMESSGTNNGNPVPGDGASAQVTEIEPTWVDAHVSPFSLVDLNCSTL